MRNILKKSSCAVILLFVCAGLYGLIFFCEQSFENQPSYGDFMTEKVQASMYSCELRVPDDITIDTKKAFDDYYIEKSGTGICRFPYEALSEIGQFRFYRFPDPESPLSLTSFTSETAEEWSFIDSTGSRVLLEIGDIDRYTLVTMFYSRLHTVSSPPDHNRMKQLPQQPFDSISAFYCYEQITYMYTFEALDYIAWQYNGILFKLTIDPAFDSYPGNSDTFTAKLLVPETAVTAVEDLMRSCFPDEEFTGLEPIGIP